MSTINYQAYLGAPLQYIQVQTGASSILYPSPDIIDVFGPIFTPRIYGKDLTALEIASSGDITFALSNARALDLYNDTLGNTFLGSYIVSDNSRNSSFIEFNKTNRSLRLCANNNVEASGGSNLIFAASNIISLVASNTTILSVTSNRTNIYKNVDIHSNNLSFAKHVVIDGASNNNSGFYINGVPSIDIAPIDQRYIKKLTWNFGSNGTIDLGINNRAHTESFWEIQGGQLRITHCKNSNASRKVSYAFRINEYDELEVVKLSTSNDQLVTNRVIARFGSSTTYV